MRDWELSAEAYVEKFFTIGSTPNGMFGAKVMWDHIQVAARNLRTSLGRPALSDHGVFTGVFPNLHYIYITRRNKQAQAVSWARAAQSGVWFEGGQRVSKWRRLRQALQVAERVRRWRMRSQLRYDFDRILEYYERIHEQERAWEAYFQAAGAQPYRIVFEEFVNTYEETTRTILRHLQLPQPAKGVFRRDLKSQTDAVNVNWRHRFSGDLGKRGRSND